MEEYTDYSTTGTLRTQSPRIETPFGRMAYWQSISFLDYGHVMLGGFEPPYDGRLGADSTITVNRVEYDGSVTVYLRRDGDIALDFSALHKRGDWRSTVSDAAQRKLEEFLLPLAKELFPIPTPANIASHVRQEASRAIHNAAMSRISKLSSDVYRDGRYKGHSEAIRAGILDALREVEAELTRETFEVNPY